MLNPSTPTVGILVEQTFPRGGATILHLHEQGDELFYVASGSGTATLGELTNEIGPGDVIFIPRNAVHRIENLIRDEPLGVVFFMDSPKLVEEFRAILNVSRRSLIDRLRPRNKPPYLTESVGAGPSKSADGRMVTQQALAADGDMPPKPLSWMTAG